jgi:hypothetical protein
LTTTAASFPTISSSSSKPPQRRRSGAPSRLFPGVERRPRRQSTQRATRMMVLCQPLFQPHITTHRIQRGTARAWASSLVKTPPIELTELRNRPSGPSRVGDNRFRLHAAARATRHSGCDHRTGRADDPVIGRRRRPAVDEQSAPSAPCARMGRSPVPRATVAEGHAISIAPGRRQV